MVGRGRRGVAAVIGRENEEIPCTQGVEEIRQPAVEVLQAAVEVDRIVAVPPEHVGLDEVDEDEALFELAEQTLRLGNPFEVRLRGGRLVDVATGKNVDGLAD